MLQSGRNQSISQETIPRKSLYLKPLTHRWFHELIQDFSTRQKFSEHGGLEVQWFFLVNLDHRAQLPDPDPGDQVPGRGSSITVGLNDSTAAAGFICTIESPPQSR